MRTSWLIACCAIASCTEALEPDRGQDDAAATNASDSSASTTEVPSASDASAASLDARLPQPPAALPFACENSGPSAVLPPQPTTFSLALEREACFGTCPVFTLSVDHDGRVTYYGESNVARFGAHEKTISREDARAVYDVVYQAGYPKLSRCYASQSDGCRVATDSPWTYWNVSGDGASKAVDRYHGCSHPSPELAQVDAAERIVWEKAGLSGWVQPAARATGGGRSPSPDAAGSYRLSHAGQSLGTLTIVRTDSMRRAPAGGLVNLGEYTWELADCAQVPVASGAAVRQPAGLILFGGLWERGPNVHFHKQQLPIALPSLGNVGSIVIDMPASGALQSARAQRGDDDLPLALAANQQGC